MKDTTLQRSGNRSIHASDDSNAAAKCRARDEYPGQNLASASTVLKNGELWTRMPKIGTRPPRRQSLEDNSLRGDTAAGIYKPETQPRRPSDLAVGTTNHICTEQQYWHRP